MLRERLSHALSGISAESLESVEALRELYTDDVVFEDPIQRIEGREAFLEMNRRLVKMSRTLRFEVDGGAGDGDEMFLTWRMTFRPKLGPAMEVRGVSHIRARGERVVSHVDYWDIASLVASAVPFGRRVLRAAFRPFV